MQTLLQDLKYGARMLRKRPGFTAIAVITLALGIGANTAIFSVVDAVLLRPLPYRDSDQLVALLTRSPKAPRDFATYPDLQDWRQQSQLISGFAGFVWQSVNLTGGDEPTRVVGCFVTANFFETLDVDAARGRTFLPGEDDPGATRVVVVSHGVWQERFGGDPDLIGGTLILNGQSYTVVGILPEEFRFQWGDADVWIPIHHWPNFANDRSKTAAAVIGRLRPGVSLKQAQSEMDTIARRLGDQYPETNRDRSIVVQRFQDIVTEDLRPSLLVLFGVVGCVLLIACANVANLLLTRAASRAREFSLRAALGANRWRLVRLTLTESVLLSLPGGVLGLWLGISGADFLATNSPLGLPPGVRVDVNLPVLGFTFAVALLTGVLFGLAPALKFSRPDLNAALKEGGRMAGGGGSRIRAALVVTQIALSFVLLTGSGLMIRSFSKLVQVSPGFNRENLLTMEYRVPRDKYREGKQQWEFHRRVVENIRALPGVKSASAVLALPYSGNFGTVDFVPLDRAEPPKGEEPQAERNSADPYYFETMQIPVLRGRVFTEQDDAGTQPVAVINQTMAKRYWPGDNPIGKEIRLMNRDPTVTQSNATIVGVVGNVRHNGLDDRDAAQIYLPYAQNPFIFATLVVRTKSEPMSLVNDVRGAVRSVDRDQPVWKVRTLASLIDRSIGPRRFVMALLGSFSGLAMLLAAIGIFGVMSYTVSQRTAEIGIRMALGANMKDVLVMILGRAMVLTCAGLAAGLGAAFAATGLITTFLFGVSATDPVTFAFVAVLLALVALLACSLPARNATRVDPMTALRYE